MAKRRANTELNHDNWDTEDEPPEDDGSGVFQRASDDEMARRKIRVARRRSDVVTTGGSDSPSVFKNFTGFGGGASKLPSFDFSSGKSLHDTDAKKLFEASSFKLGSGFSSFTSCNKENSEPLVKKSNGVTEEGSSKLADSNAEGNNKAYLANLKVLNEGVLKWIQKHLDANININLNPVFDDYRNHFDELQKRYKPKFTKISGSKDGSEDAGAIVTPNQESFSGKQSQLSSVPSKLDADLITKSSDLSSSKSTINNSENKSALFSFTAKDSKVKESTPFSFERKGDSIASDSVKTFSFGSSDTKPKESDSVKTFSFGSSDTKPKESGGMFSFGGGAPLSFGAKEGSSTTTGFSFGSGSSNFSFGSGPAAAASCPSNDAEDDAPPVEEIVEVKEADAFYEKKCKLFYKKDGAFTDKGVGTLYLKPAGETKKTQLIIRAATNLGNVLLNILLNTSLPTQRMGKNNVLIVCVPNPPIDPKDKDSNTPVSMLIRVKSAEDADNLLKQIDEHKE